MPLSRRPVMALVSHRGGVHSQRRSLLALGTPCCKRRAGRPVASYPFVALAEVGLVFRGRKTI